uniref:hypothetical protein n=1 Tax=Gelidibacter sp. TaxID=2018083 RepID=UPI00404B2A9B
MAPSNWDNHIKESLEKRQLQPSQDAWSKLQSRLESEEKKKSNKTFWWLGLAASIVGIVFISTMFFNKNEKPTNAIVETPKADIETEKSTKPLDIISEETIEIVEQSTEKSTKPNQTMHSSQIKNNQDIVETKTNELEKPKQDIINTFEDEKLKEVVAQIQELKNANDVVSENEIDALLKEAEKAIFKEKIKNANTQTVDADALLQDVEADLQQSFRDRVFEALKTSYETVKTAVAERNN